MLSIAARQMLPTNTDTDRAETLSQMTEALSKMASPESWIFRAQNTVHAQLITENCVYISSSPFTGFYNPLAGFSLLSFEITHKDAPQSVGLLWTSDQPVAETST
jgi:hypothetical protein